MCIQMGKTVDDPNRLKFETEEFYLKEEELRSSFRTCRRRMRIRSEHRGALQRRIYIRQVSPAGIQASRRA